MTKLKRLVAINKLSQKDPKWVHRDLFRMLNKDEIWISAYEKLKGKKNALLPEYPMDATSFEALKKLKELVCSEKYTFKTVKLTSIARPNGKQRPRGFSTANHNLVQEVMIMILESIYEPTFSKFSFGRPGFGCHDALNHVEKRFRWVDYVIEGDKQAYATIDHHVLINSIKKRVEDPRFIRLIWK